MIMDLEKLRALPEWEVAEKRASPLFKFRSFDLQKDANPDFQGYAASLLRDGLIYCASTFEMNDPWEGRPSFNAPGHPFDHPETQAFVDALLVDTPEAERPEWRALLRRAGLEKPCNDMQDMHRRNLRSMGIYSMSSACTHPLQWGYYGNGHRGFCWVFNNKVAPFSRAAKVGYEPEHPNILWTNWKEMDIVKLSILTKAHHWAHEGEYRIVVPERSAPEVFTVVDHNGNGEKGVGRYIRVPTNALVGVIFGHNMREANAGAIIRLAREYGRKIEYRCALVHRRKYEMATRVLDPEEVEKLAGMR